MRATALWRANTLPHHPSFEVSRVDADARAQLHSWKLASLDGAANRQMLEAHPSCRLLDTQKGRGNHASIISK
jgi:hypothetical protein